MEILNETAYKEAMELIESDIKICQRILASPAKPGLKQYNIDRQNTLENIEYWLRSLR